MITPVGNIVYPVSKNFVLGEFLPQEMFTDGTPLKTLLSKVPTKIISIAQGLRDRHGPMTINNKYRGGDRNYSCLRTSASSDYNPKSQHTLGKAIDCIFDKKTISDIWDDLEHNSQFYKDLGITRVESRSLAPTWMHFDIFNTMEKGVIQVILQKSVERRL